ncbi:hypothetical protein [Fundidesulfovibrio agrisoli]|uniref:hypothetical protein n=1 Tax=Fundidesulfovibrio agrisoli TaxID=2922717 RepID=UPI001FACD88C|nr:hypothetical protein [Fundidesulfovibrio agrisoli]
MTKAPAWAWGLFGLVLGLGAYLRWKLLPQSVMDGFDVWTYARISCEWAQGLIAPEGTWSKPGYMLLGAAASKLLGCGEATLPMLSAALDTLNVALVFLAARLAGLSCLPACLAMLFYACCPAMVLEARDGLPHISSITFVLTSYCLLLRGALLAPGRVAARYLALLLAGVAGGYAGLCHPTVLLWTVFLPVAPMAWHLLRGRRVLAALESGALYGLGAALPFLGFSALVKDETDFVPRMISLWHSIFGHGDEQVYIKQTVSLSWDKLAHYGRDMVYAHVLTPHVAWALGGMLALGALAALLLRSRGLRWRAVPAVMFRRPAALLGAALLMALVFTGLVARINGFEQWFMGDRFFLPLMPFAALLGVAALEGSARVLSPWLGGLAGAGAASVAVATFFTLFPASLYGTPPFYDSLRDALRAQNLRVDDASRLLVFPDRGVSPISVDRQFTRSDVLTFKPSTLDEAGYAELDAFIREKRVGLILFSPVVYIVITSSEGQAPATEWEQPEFRSRMEAQARWLRGYLRSRGIVPAYCQGESERDGEPVVRPVRVFSIGNHDFTAHLDLRQGRDNAFCLYATGAAK